MVCPLRIRSYDKFMLEIEVVGSCNRHLHLDGPQILIRLQLKGPPSLDLQCKNVIVGEVSQNLSGSSPPIRDLKCHTSNTQKDLLSKSTTL